MPEKCLNDIPRDLRALFRKGMDALQRENYDYAIALFNQILEKEPACYECREALRQSQFKKAGAGSGFFKKVFNTASASPTIAKGQFALRRNPIEALHIAEHVLNSDPNSSPAHRIIAEAALACGFPRTAVLSLEILSRNAPKDKQINIQFANALADLGDGTRAEKILTELARAYPLDNEVAQAAKDLSAKKTLNESGYEGLADGSGSYRDILKDKEEATSLEQEKRAHKTEDVAERLIQEYETRLKSEPDNLKLLRSLAELYTQKKQFDRALGLYKQIKASPEGGNDPGLDRAIAETSVRKFDHALDQLDPTEPDYAEKAAALEAQKREYQLEECRKRAERFPTDLSIRFELGQLCFHAGKFSEAIQEFQKAQANPHRRIQAMSYLAQCFSKRNMHDLAARTLQTALKEKVGFDDEKKDLIYNLGCVLEKMGKRGEAVEQFKQIYEVDIGYKDVAAKVDAFYAGQE